MFYIDRMYYLEINILHYTDQMILGDDLKLCIHIFKCYSIINYNAVQFGISID